MEREKMATVIEGGGETTGVILKWGGGREGGGREEGRVMMVENTVMDQSTLGIFFARQLACYRRKRTQMLTCSQSPLADFVHFKDLFFLFFFLFLLGRNYPLKCTVSI